MDESSRFFDVDRGCIWWSNGLYYLTRKWNGKNFHRKAAVRWILTLGKTEMYCMPRHHHEKVTPRKRPIGWRHHTGGKASNVLDKFPTMRKSIGDGVWEKYLCLWIQKKIQSVNIQDWWTKDFQWRIIIQYPSLLGAVQDYSFIPYWAGWQENIIHPWHLLLSMDENGIIKQSINQKEFKALTYIFSQTVEGITYIPIQKAFNFYEITGDKLIKLYQSDENLNAVYSSEEHGKTFIYLNDQQKFSPVWDGTNIIKSRHLRHETSGHEKDTFWAGYTKQNSLSDRYAGWRLRKIEPGPEREFRNVAIHMNDCILYSYTEER